MSIDPALLTDGIDIVRESLDKVRRDMPASMQDQKRALEECRRVLLALRPGVAPSRITQLERTAENLSEARRLIEKRLAKEK